MVLEFTKLEYHIIFFNRTNSNSAVPRWQNWWGTRVSETRVLEKVVVCHLFPKQCFFLLKISKKKRWYLAILAKETCKHKCWKQSSMKWLSLKTSRKKYFGYVSWNCKLVSFNSLDDNLKYFCFLRFFVCCLLLLLFFFFLISNI